MLGVCRQRTSVGTGGLGSDPVLLGSAGYRWPSVLLLLCKWTGSHLRVSYLWPGHAFLDHAEVGSGSTLCGDLRGSWRQCWPSHPGGCDLPPTPA